MINSGMLRLILLFMRRPPEEILMGISEEMEAFTENIILEMEIPMICLRISSVVCFTDETSGRKVRI